MFEDGAMTVRGDVGLPPDLLGGVLAHSLLVSAEYEMAPASRVPALDWPPNLFADAYTMAKGD